MKNSWPIGAFLDQDLVGGNVDLVGQPFDQLEIMSARARKQWDLAQQVELVVGHRLSLTSALVGSSSAHPPVPEHAASGGRSSLVFEADLQLDLVLDDLAILDSRGRLHDLDGPDVADGLRRGGDRLSAPRRATIGGSSRPSPG